MRINGTKRREIRRRIVEWKEQDGRKGDKEEGVMRRI